MDTSLRFRLQMAHAKWMGRTISRLFAESHRLPMVPGDDRVEVIRDLSYGGPDPRQAFDVYLPRKRPQAGPLPFLIFVHGGGYIVGDRRMSAALGRMVAARGVAVVAPGYRLQPETDLPGQLQDLRRMLQVVLASAKPRFGLDPARYVLGGESAGAHLSLRALQDCPPDIPTPRGWAGLYGLYDLQPYSTGVPPGLQLILETLRRGRPLDETRAEHTALRPLPSGIPLLLQHGEADALIAVDQSHLMRTHLQDAGHQVQLHTYPDASHGFIYHPGRSMRSRTGPAMRTLYRFLRRCTAATATRSAATRSSATPRGT